ncbi:hypothetical protein ACFWIQ_28670 [Kitasatospora sp. NPDC127059]|uniref:hypothetical protein n=1 Tax=unclassified Kitasatospora TaxID=2633591 RepID=UPI00365CD820
MTGTVARKSLIPVIEGMCRSLDGVVAVRQTLGFDIDDTRTDTTKSTDRGTVGPPPGPHH